MRVSAYLLVLAALAGLVWFVPVLWEPAVAAAIGATWWIFFRQPPAGEG